MGTKEERQKKIEQSFGKKLKGDKEVQDLIARYIEGEIDSDVLREFFSNNFKRMYPEEIKKFRNHSKGEINPLRLINSEG